MPVLLAKTRHGLAQKRAASLRLPCPAQEDEVVRLAGFQSSAAQLKEALKASEAECRELQGQAALREVESELTTREVARLTGAVARLEGEVQAKDGKVRMAFGLQCIVVNAERRTLDQH
jgi:hypothetical protein